MAVCFEFELCVKLAISSVLQHTSVGFCLQSCIERIGYLRTGVRVVSTTPWHVFRGCAAPLEPWILLGKHDENQIYELSSGGGACPWERWILLGTHGELVFAKCVPGMGRTPGTIDFTFATPMCSARLMDPVL